MELKDVQIYEDGSDKGKCLIINKVQSHMYKEFFFLARWHTKITCIALANYEHTVT